VLFMSMATVMGPTPPGTGVMALATLEADSDLKVPVPSDIEIAVAQTPKPVVDIAHEMGVQSDEYLPSCRSWSRLRMESSSLALYFP
jgi:hypothetical protein